MKYTNRELNNFLEDTSAAIRNENLDPAVVEGASQRVWGRLSGEQAAAAAGVETSELMVGQLRGCEDFQALIPAYLAGALSSARTMLLEDHTRECVPCRKALKEARYGNQAPRQLQAQKARAAAMDHRMTVLRWGVAAMLIAGLGMFAWPWAQRLINSFSTLNAVVEAANGNVYKVTNDKTQTVRFGDRLQKGEHIRTAKGARAVVKLPDGTRVEMRERAEVSVTENPAGVTINLERGQIMVEAAKQRDRKLFVQTDDSLVSVVGTIFSVNGGTKGSRVSVIEGEVHVDTAGRDIALHPGDQVATHVSIERIPVKDEIAWSQNATKYNQLLDELRAKIDSEVAMPGNRYSTRLLDLMPAGTVFYVAIPNISETLARADQILQENIQQNGELREWWQKEQAQARGEHGFSGVIKQVTGFGKYLGNEIVIGGGPDEILALAELKDAAGFRDYLNQQIEGQLIAGGTAKANRQLPIAIIDDPMTANIATKSSTKDGNKADSLLVWLQGDMLAASTELSTLQALAQKGNTGFAANPFHARLAEVYREGAGFLIAADLEKIVTTSFKPESRKDNDTVAMKQLGLANLRHFIVEIKEKDGKPYNRAVVSFKEDQHGFTSWLATPNPMGALEFISPDANVVAAFVVKEPTALVDDLLATLKAADPKAWDELMKFQQEQGIDLRNDFAAPLGGEYAFALDGPVLPVPSWKAVVQVDDQQHLQQTLDRTIEKLNVEAAKHGKKGFVATRTESGGRTYCTIKSLDVTLVEINYAYAYGYFIAAPSRALVENAIKYKESGYSLQQSAKFKATLPEDRQANFSAMVYQNIASLSAPVEKMAGTVKMPKGPNQLLKQFLGKKAGLAYVYALNDRMIFSVNTEDGPLGIAASDFLGLPGSGLGAILQAK
jgi:ferric-dicitrate binding protein FerR (iron transport regulator)